MVDVELRGVCRDIELQFPAGRVEPAVFARADVRGFVYVLEGARGGRQRDYQRVSVFLATPAELWAAQFQSSPGDGHYLWIRLSDAAVGRGRVRECDCEWLDAVGDHQFQHRRSDHAEFQSESHG